MTVYNYSRGGKEPVQTLTNRMGTGGGNVPYVLIERINEADEH